VYIYKENVQKKKERFWSLAWESGVKSFSVRVLTQGRGEKEKKAMPRHQNQRRKRAKAGKEIEWIVVFFPLKRCCRVADGAKGGRESGEREGLVGCISFLGNERWKRMGQKGKKGQQAKAK
jgi:hypothetical protein